MLLHEVAKVPKGEFLTAGRKLACVYGKGTREGVEIHRTDDIGKLLLTDHAEFREHPRYEL